MNCSQKLISLIFGTTFFFKFYSPTLLWIALKSWYLWYSEQQKKIRAMDKTGCELLSKVDIFDIRNNPPAQSSSVNGVVNCSQKLISLIFGTTHRHKVRRLTELWIALKSWYLWYSEQQGSTPLFTLSRCELLSKVDIFDIRNNQTAQGYIWHTVVNCSQKLISLIFGTTNWGVVVILLLLWIALKSWYLWYSEQPDQGILLRSPCCELLSKVDIFDIRNNRILKHPPRLRVVNCSQKLISLIFGTTSHD